MSRVHSSVRRFLDVEATVDHDEESSDDDQDQDLEDAFIDNSTDDQDGDTQRFFNGGEDEDEVQNAVLEQMLRRAYNAPKFEFLRSWEPSYVEQAEAIVGHPGNDDYPIWRVECRIGAEEMAVMSLLETAQDHHELRSAFTRGNIRGCIYLESRMNQHLMRLLEKTPGIIRNRGGIRLRAIDPLDCPNLLRMKNVEGDFHVGQWVLVTKGLYKGDVGLLSATHSWGVDVLLIPRLPYHPTVGQKSRASAVRHPPKLFDREEFQRTSTAELVSRQDGCYILGRLLLMHGLALKSFAYVSISSEVRDISWNSYSLFASCGHPDVDLADLPRPREWVFFEKEKVSIRASGKRGVIQSAEHVYIDVELLEEGVHRFTWRDIRKDFAIGDFVEVVGGCDTGYKGWIIELNTDMATVLDKVTDDHLKEKNLQTVAAAITVHTNCLTVTEAPYQFTSQTISATGNIYLEKGFRHPWCGTEIIISKIGHPRKGEAGRILEVLFKQNTRSGMRLEIQLLQYNPNTPFHKITLDYADVVEFSTRLEIDKFFKSRGNELRRIALNNETEHTAQDCRWLTRPALCNLSRCETPMPEESSSTLVWNPSSATPDQWTSVMPANAIGRSPSSGDHVLPENRRLQLPSSNRDVVHEPPHGPHILLKKCLLDIKMNVTVNGGPYKEKELVASISLVDGSLRLHYQKYTTTYSLQPEWVTPKYPSATRDNGLLIVIDGEHSGKFVRRIYHRHAEDGQSFVILAVVNRTAGYPDFLTGEQLEIDRNFLCTVFKTKEEKILNKDIMNVLRTTYPKPSRH